MLIVKLVYHTAFFFRVCFGTEICEEEERALLQPLAYSAICFGCVTIDWGVIVGVSNVRSVLGRWREKVKISLHVVF